MYHSLFISRFPIPGFIGHHNLANEIDVYNINLFSLSFKNFAIIAVPFFLNL